MSLKLRRPVRGTARPQFADGGAARSTVTVAATPAEAGPTPEQQRAAKALRNAGVDRPSPAQRAIVEQAAAQGRGRPAVVDGVGPAVARALQVGGSDGPVPGAGSSIPPHIQAALNLRPTFARGGAVGLPASPFSPAALPSVPTPGLASPRGMIAARHRAHFAAGGAALPPHILAALARPHFADGGDADSPWFGDGGQPAPQQQGFAAFGGDAAADPSAGDGGGWSGGSAPWAAQPPGQAWGIGGDSPDGPPEGQPTIEASLPAQALPSAAHDPSGLLQNGTDTGAIARFWGADTPQGAAASPGQPPRQQSATPAPIAPASGGAPTASPPVMATAPAPQLYNPMADPTVRASLHLATGGRAALPETIRAALALRPHFDDGGGAGGAGGAGGGNGEGGGNGGAGAGGSGGSSGSSGGSDGSGGSDRGSSDRGGSDGNSSNGASGSGGGVGGFGGGAGGSDGYGGGGGGGGGGSGGHSDASTGNANGSAAGVGGSAVGSGGSDRGSTAAGGQSDAASGAANGSSAGVGSSGQGYGSATSGAVGSIGGSVGAPSAGGFSSVGAPATGGFGGFGATPSATSNVAGFSGGTPTASSIDGRTAGQQAAAEAAGGAPGEDGTTSAGTSGSLTTGQAFASFGPSATVGAFGAPPSAMQSYGAVSPNVGTFGSMTADGVTPGSPLANQAASGMPATVAAALAASPYGAGPSGMQDYGAVSPNVGTFAGLGADGVKPGAIAGLGVGPAGVMNGPAAYGLSTTNLAGFDNFNSAGQVASTSIGPDGYTGGFGGGIQDAMNNSLADADSFADAHPGLPGYAAADGFRPDYSGFHLGPDGKPDIAAQGARQAAGFGELGSSLKGLGAFGSGATPGSPASTAPTGTTPGLNADGDPVAVAGTPALTIHGPMTEAAYGRYDAPGPVSPFGGITDKQVYDARQNMIAGTGTPADSAIASGYVAQQNSPVGRTPGLVAGLGAVDSTSALTIHGNISPFSGAGLGDLSPSAAMMAGSIDPATNITGTPTVHTFAQASPTYGALDGGPLAKAYNASTLSNDVGTPSMPTFATMGLAKQTVGMGPMTTDDGAQPAAPSVAAPAPTAPTAPDPNTVVSNIPGVPPGAYFVGLHHIEGGVLDGQVDPKNPTHYGPAQFDQPTWDGVARAHPEYGVTPGVSMFGATAEQYANMTVGLTQMNQAGLQKAGIEATPANTYMAHQLGLTGAIRAIRAGPDASLADAGISPRVQAANPSIYGGMQTIGQVQANIAGKLERGAVGASTAPAASAPSAGYSAMGLGLGAAPGTFSPDGVSYGTAPSADPSVAAPAMGPLTVSPSPAPAPAPVTHTVTTPTAYAGTDAETAAANGIGYEATPMHALTIHAFGLKDPANPESPVNAAANIMGLPADTPIKGMTEYADSDQMGVVTKNYVPVVSQAAQAAAEAKYPGLFDGVQTVGDLRGKLATIAATAGPPSVSTVTEPGQPAASGPAAAPAATPSMSPTVAAALNARPWGGDLGSYQGADGTDTGFGLGAIAAGVPQTVNNAGTLGVPSGVGVTQAEQNFTGYAQVPSTLPSFARTAVAAPGFKASDGFSATPGTSAPGATPSTSTGTPDTSTTAHPSVPKGITNGAANVALGALGGPIGGIIAGINGLSGVLGGPTIADGINGLLAGSSGAAPVSTGGQGGNGTAGTREGGGSGAAYYGPSAGSTASALVPPPSPSGVSPLDPHADAQAAYQAAMAGMHRGPGADASGSSQGDGAYAGHARPLTIHRRSFAASLPRPPSTYNPLTDPSVRHALGLDG